MAGRKPALKKLNNGSETLNYPVKSLSLRSKSGGKLFATDFSKTVTGIKYGNLISVSETILRTCTIMELA